MRAMVFPGQGTQFVGMGKEWNDTFSAAKETFQEIDDALNQHLSRLMFDGSETDLFSTENTQPALMALSMAILRVIEHESGRKREELFGLAAGHSLGEYTACCAAKAFDIPTAARLLKERGLAMKNAVAPFTGGMAAVIGSSVDALRAVTNDKCFIANDNAPSQTVLSGENDALDTAMAHAKEMGAKRVVKLNVSAPFHTPFMKPAADAMRLLLAKTDIRPFAVPVVGNATADIITDARTALVDQITHGVRWRETMTFFEQKGVAEVVEIGAGTVLKGLVRKNSAAMTGVSVNTPADIEVFLKTL